MKRIIYLILLACICMPSLFARNSTARGLFAGAGTGALFGGLIGGGRGAGWGALAGGVVGTAIGASKDADRRRYYRDRYDRDRYDSRNDVYRSRDIGPDDEEDENYEDEENYSSSNGYRNRISRAKSTRRY